MVLPCSLRVLGLHGSNCLNRHTDDVLQLPGLVQLEIIPPGFPRSFVATFTSTRHVPSSVMRRLGNVTRDPRRAT